MVHVPGTELPIAIRATAGAKRSLLRREPVFTYDVRFADGAELRDVNIDEVLQGHRFPADAWVTRHAAEQTCPERGAGPWVEYPSGRLIGD